MGGGIPSMGRSCRVRSFRGSRMRVRLLHDLTMLCLCDGRSRQERPTQEKAGCSSRLLAI